VIDEFWTTSDGSRIRLKDMTGDHMKNAIRRVGEIMGEGQTIMGHASSYKEWERGFRKYEWGRRKANKLKMSDQQRARTKTKNRHSHSKRFKKQRGI
jgi:hypothetical protein